MKLSWQDAQTFLAVAEHQSFSAAARALEVGQPTISRRIQELELTLKQQLFIRGKQGASPTEAAIKLIPAAEQMARWASEFDRAAMDVEQVVSGTITIAAPPGIAVDILAPFAKKLRTLEPQIRLEILAGVDHIDLTRGGADLAIRTQAPTEPELVALHHEQSQPAVYSAQSYANNIKQPCDWADLDWICWSKPYKQVQPRPMLEKLIPNFEPILSSDSYLVQKAALIQGIGAMIISSRAGENLSKQGLVQIDVGVTLPKTDAYIVCAKSMRHVPRLMTVVEHMISSL
ncbi:MAG: LysR family transcriptional regulator [Pseudomonadales bacterium]|nr:LysR family transcriptional regulator [Pseudomonadales bacterium]